MIKILNKVNSKQRQKDYQYKSEKKIKFTLNDY